MITDLSWRRPVAVEGLVQPRGVGRTPVLQRQLQAQRVLAVHIANLQNEGRKEMFYLTTHSTHFIYGYMASDIWLMTILIVRKETRCRHIGYSFRLTARVFYMHHPTDRKAHTTQPLLHQSWSTGWNEK